MANDENGNHPKDSGGFNPIGMTTGGKYVPLGDLRTAQAEEDAENEAKGERMRQDVEAAAHPHHEE